MLSFMRGRLGFSRAAVTALKEREDGILLNGERVTVRAVLHEGDTLCLGIEDRGEDVNGHILPRALPLDILYEDENIICVNKSADMPTHPTHGHYDDTLANALAHYSGEKGIPFVFRAVNRLDRDTSGIVLVAKNQASADYIARQIRERTVVKKYIAVCEGALPERGSIKTYIRRMDKSIITRANYDSGSDSEFAHTEYTVLESEEKYSIVEAEPVTGRTHQLRVHFSGLGHPIIGDTLYGNDHSSISRQALHASSLTFRLPFDGAPVTVRAPLADDIKALIKEIK